MSPTNPILGTIGKHSSRSIFGYPSPRAFRLFVRLLVRRRLWISLTTNVGAAISHRHPGHSQIVYYRVEYDKMKLKDQVLILPVAKTIDYHKNVARMGNRYIRSLSGVDHTYSVVNHTHSVPGGRYSRSVHHCARYERNTPTTPDLLSYPDDTHSYKYSNYKLFRVCPQSRFSLELAA